MPAKKNCSSPAYRIVGRYYTMHQMTAKGPEGKPRGRVRRCVRADCRHTQLAVVGHSWRPNHRRGGESQNGPRTVVVMPDV